MDSLRRRATDADEQIKLGGVRNKVRAGPMPAVIVECQWDFPLRSLAIHYRP